MSQNFRQSDILQIAEQRGRVTVEELAAHFHVTVQTIRRDLAELDNLNKLERVHGGAVLPSGTRNIQYEERRNLNDASKNAIAKTCAQHVAEGSSVFLNIGTSTEAVAHQLLHHKGLMLVTNNMNVAQIFTENTRSQTIVTGGTLRRSDNGMVGTVAVETIRQFKFDIAVIGCSAMDEDGDLLDFDVDEVAVSQAIIAQSRKCFLVADSSKLERTAPVRIASMRSLSAVFTDKPFPRTLARKCQDWQTKVIVNQMHHPSSG